MFANPRSGPPRYHKSRFFLVQEPPQSHTLTMVVAAIADFCVSMTLSPGFIVTGADRLVWVIGPRQRAREGRPRTIRGRQLHPARKYSLGYAVAAANFSPTTPQFTKPHQALR